MIRPILEWSTLGTVPYREALERQERRRDAVLAGQAGPRLLLLEHPATITLGRRGTDRELRVSTDSLASRGVELVQTDRGGLATYHGPGQLVGYPIVDLNALKLGVHDYVQALASGLTALLAEYGVEARWSEEHPGLWVGAAKIAAFGVRVRRGVTTHGFALNVRPDLGGFGLIVPCGLADAPVCSLASLGAIDPAQSGIPRELCERAARHVAAALKMNPQFVADGESFSSGVV